VRLHLPLPASRPLLTSCTLLAALVVLLLVPATFAAKPSEREPTATSPGTPRYETIRRLPDAVTLATLDNGLTVIVQENHVAPVATVRCYVKNTGSAFEGRHLGAGLSHVLEHVVAGGTTTRRTEQQIRQMIDAFGGATNAYTSTDMTAFYIDCPARNVATAVELVAGFMQHVKFEPSEFARELKVVRQELADGEVDRQRVLWRLLNQAVYLEHPARHPVIGYLDVLNATTNETIIDFYRRRYVPNNQVFVVVGDVKSQEILDEVARRWAGTARGYETPQTLPEEPEQLTPREAVREMDGATYDMAFAWPTVKLSETDMYALDVAAYILGEGESSRLVRRLKYDRPLVLSVNAASHTPHFVRGFFAVLASAQPDTWKQASGEILREVYRLRDELVGAEELAKAKKQKAAEQVFDRQTVQRAAESLGHGFLATGDPLFDQKYVENIQKVTAEQVRDAARRYFVPQRLSKVTLAPPGGLGKQTGPKSDADQSDVRKVTLPNGLRVLLKRHSNLPLVNMQAFVLAGTLADTTATAGRSRLVAQMLDKGTAQYTDRQIAETFDAIGAQMSIQSGRNTIYGSLTTLREDFPKASAVFAECFTRPTFPQAEFEKVRQLALGAIARRASDPHQEAFELFYDNLPADSPYHVLEGGKAESVQKLSVQDLRGYHQRYFVPNNMVVTVFGDIDPDVALELVKQQFGPLKADPGFQPVAFDRANGIAQPVRRHKQTGKPTGMVVLGYPTADILNKPDYAALTVLDAILSGYSYPGGWLHEELRGEGLVYFVHAMQITGPAPGYFTIFSQTRPDKIDEVVQRIHGNLDRARKGKIAPEEFRTAIDMILALHAQDNTTMAEQARQAALDELYGLGYDYDKSFPSRISAVTVEDVVRVARKYLDKSVLVTTSPHAK